MKIECLVDGQWGIYLPQEFAKRYNAADWGISDEDENILLCGPNHPDYWDVWDDVLGYAHTIHNGEIWHIYQHGDLFSIKEGESYEF
jgi:hypothetical protein